MSRAPDKAGLMHWNSEFAQNEGHKLQMESILGRVDFFITF